MARAMTIDPVSSGSGKLTRPRVVKLRFEPIQLYDQQPTLNICS
jgi:hypothetical protein